MLKREGTCNYQLKDSLQLSFCDFPKFKQSCSNGKFESKRDNFDFET